VAPNPSRSLLAPSPALRAACAVAFVVLVANLFWLGAKPFAVGLLPPPWDKLGHLALFGALAALLMIAGGGRWPVAVFLAVCAVGVADELFQATLPGRHADWGDLGMDALAAALAIGAFAWLASKARDG